MEARMAKRPVIAGADGIRKLERILLNSKQFNEAWLQDLLANEPSILPTASIDAVYAPLFSIGREVPVTSGFIDNLYISPKGYIVIVETKLWRNPEARREVVGQIVDYAKDLKEWDYEQLNDAYKSQNSGSGGIFEAMVEQGLLYTENEATFIDTTEKNLQNARFLLMIIGDGIRESVERMADFLNETPNMQYRLALCELEVYDLGDDERLVVPQLTTKTTIVERGVIRVEGATSGVSVEMYTDDEEVSGTKQRKAGTPKDSLSLGEWLSQQSFTDTQYSNVNELLSDFEDLGYMQYIGTADLNVAYFFENLSARLKVLMFWGGGCHNVGFMPKTFYKFLDKYGYSTTIADNLLEGLRKYLKPEQNNIPYEKPNAYYSMDIQAVLDNKDDILSLFEKFKSNF